MFNRLMILGIAVVVFVLGANYLLVYTLNKERERQDRTYWTTYTAIEQFGEHPDAIAELKARDALENARQKGLAKIRVKILQTYLEDLEHCYQGDRDACKRGISDMNEAMKVQAERK